MVLGINPSAGLTSVVVLMLAWILGLNRAASLVGAHAVTPIHLLLFIPFIEIGVHLFHTRGLPVSRQQIEPAGTCDPDGAIGPCSGPPRNELVVRCRSRLIIWGEGLPPVLAEARADSGN